MLVIVVLAWLLYVLYANHQLKSKLDSSRRKLLFAVHAAFGIVLAVLATQHGLAHLGRAPLPIAVPGLLTLVLLWVQVALGASLKLLPKQASKARPTLMKLHRLVPRVLLVTVVIHLAVRFALF